MSLGPETVCAAGDDQQKAAPLGLFVLLLLGVGCYFLFKSMSRHLKRVREQFPSASSGTGSPATRPVAGGSSRTDSARATPGAGDAGAAAEPGWDGTWDPGDSADPRPR